MTTPAPHKRPAYEPAARLLRPTGYNPDMPRPASTIAGVVLVGLRVVAGVIVLIGIPAAWDAVIDAGGITVDGVTVDAISTTAAIAQLALWIALGFGAMALALDALFAVLIFRGHNWPRVVVMFISVISITSAFIAWWVVGEEITLQGTFLSLSLDILVLLALSSRSAAAYARRNDRR